MPESFDVAVIGAGPVGLLLAIELSLAGARPLVLERLAAPSTMIKALGIGPVGVEALQRRGMGGALDAAEARNLAAVGQLRAPGGWSMRSGKSSGHFGFLSIPAEGQAEPERRMRLVAQGDLEALLAERARKLGVELRRGCELAGFAQDAGGVDLEWAGPSGPGRARCAYLVGCDGGRSAVRKGAGFAFPGTPPTLTMYQAVLDLDAGGEALPGGWHRTERGVFARGPFPRRLFLLDFSGPPADRAAPVTRGEIEAVLRRISGADVRVAALEAANRWADNTRLADRYRDGRVFLAGDAAHVHAPFGGQGLSLGLGDAANLGWKLAAALRGGAPAGLLDSYGAERRPVAEAVLANTLAQVAVMRPDPQSGAMRDVLARLLGVEGVARHLGEAMRGLAVRYDLGSDRDAVGRLLGDRAIPCGRGEHSLYGLMQDGRGLLLDASPGAHLSVLAAAAAPAVRPVAVDGGPSMLLRPDGCLAWLDEAHGAEGLARALGRWFGAPAPGGRADARGEARRVA